MTLGDRFHDLAGRGEHGVVIHARQEAAVHIEDVPARQGIDVEDVFLMARGHEGAAGRLENRVRFRIERFEIAHVQDHVGSGHQRVAAFVRPRAVRFLPRHFHAQPELSLFGNLDEGAVRHAIVRDDHEIVRAEEVRAFLHDVVHPVVARRLFVGNENQAERKIGGEVEFAQLLGDEQAADDGLLVVFHAAPVNAVAVHDRFPRVALPVGKLPGGHHVHVAQNPQAAGRLAGNAGHDVGPHAVGHAVVGGVDAQDVAYAEIAERPFEIEGFRHFARAAVVRPESRNRGHAGLIANDRLALPPDLSLIHISSRDTSRYLILPVSIPFTVRWGSHFFHCSMKRSITSPPRRVS